MNTLYRLVWITAGLLLFWSCGPDASNQQSQNQASPEKNNPEGALTEWQIVHGLGPIKSELKLGAIDPAVAEEGAQIFETKCSMCHKMDERYVGPPLGDIALNRSPEYIMNMILDPTSMVKYHPEVKKLLAQYYTPMTFQNVTEEDALKILEFFRQQGTLQPTK